MSRRALLVALVLLVLAPTRADARPAAPSGADARPTPPSAVAMASADDVTLVLPSRRARMVGYHEALSASAQALAPLGTPLANENAKRATTPAPSPGPDYVIMASRGRGTAATSAVDVALPRRARVRAPVSGTVVAVGRYTLYGRYADRVVTIAPAGPSDVLVVAIHLRLPRVRPGDEVVAGRTTLARRARLFPFPSQVDRWAGRGPHVHLEVRTAGPSTRVQPSSLSA